MFLSFFNNDEKKAFLGLAYQIAMTDGEFHEEEKAMMSYYEYESGISLGEEKNEDIKLLSSRIKGQNRVYCMIELLSLAFSDSDYSEDEQKLIGTISAEFNLNEKTIQYLIEWLDRQNKLTKEITDFAKEYQK